MSFDYVTFYGKTAGLTDRIAGQDDGSPDELAAVRALRDHLNTYPGIDDDGRDDAEPWKLRADWIDAAARYDHAVRCGHNDEQRSAYSERLDAADALRKAAT